MVTINAALARKLYGATDPIGRRLSVCTDPAAGKPHWVTIVGVTGDIRADGLGEPPQDAVHFTLGSKDEMWVQVTPSAHHKCARCWHLREDVGSHAKHPELCGRCVSNVDGDGEPRQFA